MKKKSSSKVTIEDRLRYLTNQMEDLMGAYGVVYYKLGELDKWREEVDKRLAELTEFNLRDKNEDGKV